MLNHNDVRRLRAVEPELVSYFRPLKRDLSHYSQLLAQGLFVGSGIVLDASFGDSCSELREEARRAGLEIVLDSRAMELATEGGFARPAFAELPWAGDRLHQPGDFAGEHTANIINGLMNELHQNHATAVLAPTHYLESSNSPWLTIDAATTRRLRSEMDKSGLADIPIYYPLASSLSNLVGPNRQRVLATLSELPVDALWLRIHNFGTTSSGPVNLSRFVALSRQLHGLGIPVVGEKTGTLGLALLAIGALGGIESGVTLGENYSVASLLRPSTGQPFLRPPRVYLHLIGAFVERGVAERLLGRRGMHQHICQGQPCCPRGVTDMISDPRRHFLVSRTHEVQALSQIPSQLRFDQYLESWLRPAGDRATRSLAAESGLRKHRDRLDQWRGTLTAIRDEDAHKSVSRSVVPEGNRISRSRGA